VVEDVAVKKFTFTFVISSLDEFLAEVRSATDGQKGRLQLFRGGGITISDAEGGNRRGQCPGSWKSHGAGPQLRVGSSFHF